MGVIRLAWYVRVLAKFFALSVQLYIIPHYITLYGSDAYGEFATVVSLVAVLNLFDFGVSKKTMLDIAEGKVEGVQSGFVSVLTITLFLGIFLGVVLYFFSNLFNLNSGYCVLLAATSGLFFLNNFFYDVLRGLQKPVWASLGYLLQVVITSSVLVLGAVHQFHLSIIYTCSYVFPLVALLIVNILYFRPVIRISFIETMKYIDRESLSFFILGLMQFVNLGSGLLLVNTLMSSEDSAAYSIVHRVIGLFIFVNSAMMINLPAYIARNLQSKASIPGVRVYLMGISLFTALVYCFLIPSVTDYLNLTDVEIGFQTLFSGLLLNIVIYMSSYVIVQLNARRLVSVQVPFLFVCTVTNLCVIVSTVKDCGFYVIPLSTALTYLFFVVFPLSLLLRRVRIRENVSVDI